MNKATSSQELKYLATLSILRKAVEAGDEGAASVLASLDKLDGEQVRLKEAGLKLYAEMRAQGHSAEYLRRIKSIIDRLIGIKAERKEIVRSLRSNNMTAVYFLYSNVKKRKRNERQ